MVPDPDHPGDGSCLPHRGSSVVADSDEGNRDEQTRRLSILKKYPSDARLVLGPAPQHCRLDRRGTPYSLRLDGWSVRGQKPSGLTMSGLFEMFHRSCCLDSWRCVDGTFPAPCLGKR